MGNPPIRPWSIVFFPLMMLLLSTILLGQVAAETTQNVYQGPLIDAHYHYSFSTSSRTQKSEDEALAQMKQAGVVKIIAFTEFGSISALKTHPEYFMPFFQIARRLSPGEPGVVDEIRRALDGGFIGIGEVAYRSTGAREDVAADNPLALQIVDLAAERGVVICIHQEVGTRKYGEDYIPEFERLLDHNKNVVFLWAHVGYARPDTVAKLMASHLNFYGDLSTRTPGHALSSVSGFIADREGALFPGWREVFERFPDRFTFGTDNVFEGDQKSRDYFLAEVTYFRKVLGQLPLDLAERIAYGNIQKVMKLGQSTSLSINVDPASIFAGSPVKVSGKLLPAMKDVTIALTATSGGDAKRVILKTADDGSFTGTIIHDKTGQWGIVASTPGAIGWIGSESNSVTLLVQAQTPTLTPTSTPTPTVIPSQTVTSPERFESQIPGGYMTIAILIVVAVTVSAVLLKRRRQSAPPQQK